MKNKKIFLIGNPVAGGGTLKKIRKAEKILKVKGFTVETLLTKAQGDAEKFARQINEIYPDNSIVLAAGGDGTYNEVANGLAFSETPMAILPMGTTSVLAKELKIPYRIEKAIEVSLNGRVQKVHLGRIKNQEKQRFFILMAGIGFDGSAVYKVKPRGKRYLKKIAYILSGIKSLLKYTPPEIEIFNSKKKKANNAVVCNASCYGGSFKIAPQANLKDPYFYVIVSKTHTRIELVYQILGVIFGFHLKLKNIDYFKTETLKISGDAHVQIDGDYFGKTPVDIELIKNALNLVFPG